MSVDILMGGASPWLPTGYGMLVRHIAPYLVKQGWKTCLVSPSYRGEEMMWQGVKVIASYEGAMHSSYAGRERILMSLKKQKPKVVLAIGDLLILDYLLEEKKKPFKLMCYFPIDADPWRPKELEMIKKIDYPVVPSKFAIGVLEKEKLKAHYIPHGVDTKLFKPKNKILSRKEYGLTAKQFVYLYVGTNNLRKNTAGLLEAFKLVKTKVKDSVLILATCFKDPSGYDLPAIIKAMHMEKRVVFPEYSGYFALSGQELATLYNCADVFVSATTGEGASICHMEAMACGIPSVSPRNSALTELIGDTGILSSSKGGFYDSFGSWRALPCINDLANNMVRIAKEKSLRAELAKKSMKKGRTLDWKYVLPKWKKLMEEVI